MKEMIAANTKSDYPTLGILSDLNHSWFFTWLDEERSLVSTTTGRIEDAIGIIRAFLVLTDSTFTKNKVRLKKIIDDIKRKGDVPDRMIDYMRGIQKVYPPREHSDVAPMSELFDDMSYEEITAWRLKEWGQLLKNTRWIGINLRKSKRLNRQKAQ